MNRRRSSPRMRPKVRAEEYLDRARELYGFSDDSHPDLLQEALKTAKKSLLLDPRNSDTLVLLGSIYLDFDDPKSTAQALRYYDKAIAIHPEGSSAYSDKADLLMYWLHQPEEAERLARKALALSVRSGEVSESMEHSYSTLIDILIGAQEIRTSRWLIRRALRTAPASLCEIWWSSLSKRSNRQASERTRAREK